MAHIIEKRLTKSNCKFAGLEKGWHNPIWDYQEFVGYSGAIQAWLFNKSRKFSVHVTDKGLLSLSPSEIEELEEYRELQELSFPLDLDAIKEKIERLLARIDFLHHFEGIDLIQVKEMANKGFQKVEELVRLHEEVIKYINGTLGYTDIRCVPWLKRYISYHGGIFGAICDAQKSDWKVRQIARRNFERLPELIEDVYRCIEKVVSSFSLAADDRKQLYVTWLDLG